MFSIIYLKLTVGQEFSVKMQKKNCLKPKFVKNKTETMRFKNGWPKFKKILKPVKLSLMKKVNKTSIKKIGGKIINLKIQNLSL